MSAGDAMPPRTIVLASANAHKAEEFQRLARDSQLPVIIASAGPSGGMPAVVEDAGTFVGNARKKARALADRLPPGSWVLADDSGLCVDALGGAPGVESAYFAGPQGDSAANLRKMIEVIRDVPDTDRGAHFLCVLLLLVGRGDEQVFQGVCGGRLRREPRGGSGFGYDPLFVPDGYQQTYAELGDEVKSRISHRARAWQRFVAWFRQTHPA